MNTTNDNTVVILGAGATIGSGYTLCGQTLPSDRGFFGNRLVRERLSKYPALHEMLSFFRKVHGDDLSRVGLEEVWTFLDFSSRPLYRLLADLANERNAWSEAIRTPASARDDDHYLTMFYRGNRMIPVPTDLDLHLLAGWDLRRLVSEIYGPVHPPADLNVYKLLLTNKIPPNGAITFISFNYDLVLEHALTRASAPWYYAHVSTTDDRNQRRIQLIKPHGSLNWLFTKGRDGSVPSASPSII